MNQHASQEQARYASLDEKDLTVIVYGPAVDGNDNADVRASAAFADIDEATEWAVRMLSDGYGARTEIEGPTGGLVDWFGPDELAERLAQTGA